MNHFKILAAMPEASPTQKLSISTKCRWVSRPRERRSNQLGKPKGEGRLRLDRKSLGFADMFVNLKSKLGSYHSRITVTSEEAVSLIMEEAKPLSFSSRREVQT